MATITSNGTGGGNWDATASWAGGVIPTSSDQVTIVTDDTVTLASTNCVCDTLDVNGTANCSPTASSKLVSEGVITIKRNTGTFNMDVSSDNAVSCEIVLRNNVSNANYAFIGENKCLDITFKGFPRTRWTNLNGATSIGATTATVVSATGWAVGDIIVITNTTPGTNNGNETVVLTAVSGNNITWVGGNSNSYQTGGYIANMSSNMIITSGVQTENGQAQFYVDVRQEDSSYTRKFSNVEFLGLGNSFRGGVYFYSQHWMSESFKGMDDCSFYQMFGNALVTNISLSNFSLNRCVFYTTNEHSTPSYKNAISIGGSFRGTTCSENLFIELPSGYANYGSSDVAQEWVGDVFLNCRSRGGDYLTRRNTKYVLLGSANSTTSTHIDCDVNTAFGDTRSLQFTDIRGMAIMSVIRCNFGSGIRLLAGYFKPTFNVIGSPDAARVYNTGQDGDPTFAKIMTNFSTSEYTYERENTTVTRSTSSFKFKTLEAGRTRPYEILIPVKNNETVIIVGYVQRSDAGIVATVTLSGLGTTPDVFTCTEANDVWQRYELTVTNGSGSAGELSINYSASHATLETEHALFSGVPDFPYVVSCRHYGYLFNESSPKRTVNVTISATEATAAGYSGVTFDWGLTQTDTDLTDDMTFQYLYDLSQYEAITNLNDIIAVEGAGLAGAPVLISNGDVTTTGFTLNGAGQLSIGSFTLTGNEPFGYTYTGGIFSQLTTLPLFSGGTLTIGAAATYTLNTVDTIVNLTSASTDTYTLTGEHSGTLDLRNVNAFAITVIVPTGTTTTTAGNTGGTITVEEVPTTYNLLLPNIIDDSRFQIYNVTQTTELDNALVSGGSGIDLTYTKGTDYDAGDEGRYRITYSSGVTAKDSLTGTFTFPTATAENSLPISQANDSIYNTIGIDGSGVTKFTADYTDTEIDLTIATDFLGHELYSWFVYNLTLEQGIRLFFGAYIARDIANFENITSVAAILLDNTTSTNVVQTDNVRFYRDDEVYPVKKPTTGGGGIDVVWRDKVFIAETGVSGLTPAESIQLSKINTVDTKIDKTLTTAKFIGLK